MESSRLTSKLLVFEGINGCGKSTQIQLTRKYLENKGLRVGVFYDPGICDVCDVSIKELRQAACRGEWINPRTRLLLFLACRAELNQHLSNIQDDYDVILLDRYFPSTYAYQSLDVNIGTDLLHDLIQSTNNFQVNAVFFFDVLPEVAYERSKTSARDIEEGIDVYEKKKIDFLTKLRTSYLDSFANFNDSFMVDKLFILPGFGTPDEMFKTYQSYLDELLNGIIKQK